MELRQSRFDLRPAFDGATFEEDRDGTRLARQLDAVRREMQCGRWVTLAELSRVAKASEASVSARIRDLRKARFGNHTIQRRYVGEGLWQYRMMS